MLTQSFTEEGRHALTNIAEVVGAAMVIGGAALVVIRSMLKGMDKRTKEHIDKATHTLIPNGGDSLGDLPDALRQLAKQNSEEHDDIRVHMTEADSKNVAEHRRIYDKLQDHREHTDDRIDEIKTHQQTLIEKLTFRHPSDTPEED